MRPNQESPVMQKIKRYISDGHIIREQALEDFSINQLEDLKKWIEKQHLDKSHNQAIAKKNYFMGNFMEYNNMHNLQADLYDLQRNKNIVEIVERKKRSHIK